MATSAEFDVIIDVITKNLVQAKKELTGLTGELQKTSKAQKDASVASAEHDYRLNQGVTGTSSAAKSFSKLSQTIGSGPNGLVGAYATLAANAFAVSAAFNQLRAAAQVEQVLQGLEAQGARLGQTLTITAKKIQEITNYSVSASDAMKATAQASASGIKSDALQKMADVASNAAIALGRNVPDALDRIIKGTSKLEPELLDELGIMVKLDEASAKYANSIGKPVSALTRFQKSQAFANAVIAEGEAKFGGLNKSVDVNVYDKLAATFQNLINDVLNWINALGPLKSILEELSSNEFLLGTTLLLFVSSVTKAVIPSVLSLSKASAEAAVVAEASIAKKLEEIDANNKLAASEHALSVAKAASSANIANQAPKKVKEFFSKAETGSVTSKDVTSAEKSVALSTAIAEKKIESLKTTLAAQGSLTEAEEKNLALQQSRLEANKRYLDSIKAVVAAQNSLTGVEQAAAAKTKILQLEKAAAEQAATRSYKEAEAIGALSSSNQIGFFARIAQAASGGKEAVSAYRDEVVAANAVRTEQATSRFAKMFASIAEGATETRTAFYGLRLGVKMLSVGLLEVVPQIAAALMILETLWTVGKAVWDYLNPPSEVEKKLKAVREEYEKILETAKKTADYTSNIFEDALLRGAQAEGGATKQAAAFKALSNSINEVAAKYKEIEALKKQQDSPSFTTVDTNYFKKDIEKATNSTVQSSDEYKAILALMNYGYKPLSDEIRKATIESKAFKDASGNSAKQQEILGKAVANAQAKYGTIGAAIESLRNSYSELDKGIGTFIQNATVKTPYDTIADGLTKTASSMYTLRAEFERGSISATDFYTQLTSLSDRSLSAMSKNTQAQYLQVKELTQQMAAAKQSGDYTQINAINMKLKSADEGYKTSLYKDLEVQQAIYAERQKDYVITEGLIKLENARFSKNSDLLKNSVAGRQAEIAHQEKINNLQKSKLQGEVISLENMNFQIVNSRKIIESEIDALKIKREQLRLDLVSRSLQLETMSIGVEKAKAIITYNKLLEEYNKGEQAHNAMIFDLQSSLLTTKQQEAQLGNAILSKKQEIAALDATALTSAEKAAEVLGIQANTYSDMAKKRVEMLTKVADLQQKINTLESNSQDKLLVNLRNQNLAYASQATSLAQSHKAEIDQLDVQIAKVRAASTIDEETKRKIITLAQTQKQQLEDQYQLELKILETTRIVNIVESAKLDIYKEGIELQQQSFAIAQKTVDLNKSLIDQQKEIALAQAKLAATKVGLQFDSNSKAALAIEYAAAQKEYQLALDSYELKMHSIDAEYDLLEAQRLATVAELKMRSAILEQFYKTQEGGMTQSQQTALDQIRAAADNYAAQTYDSARALAKAQENNNVTLLKLKAEQAKKDFESPINKTNTQFTAVLGAFQQLKAIVEAKKDSETKANVPTTEYKAPNLQTLEQTLNKTVNSFKEELGQVSLKLPNLVQTVDNLNNSFNALIATLKNIGELNKGAQGANTGIRQISTLKDSSAAVDQAETMAKAIGAIVSERNATDGHSGKGHGEGRAIDINAPGGMIESQSSSWKGKFDKLAEDYVKRGYVVLWNKLRYSLDAMGNVTTSPITTQGKGDWEHTRHLHVEAPADTQYGMKSSAAVAQTIASPTKASAAPEAPASKEIVVTGQKPKSPFNNLEPLKTTPMDLSGLLTQVPQINLEPQKTSIKEFFAAAEIASQPFFEELKKLGPNGELVVALGQGVLTMGNAFTSLGEHIKSGTVSMKEIAEVASAALATISNVLAASANAKTAAIDKEISAEQKRDGKSAESVKKINEMQKRKDDIQRKAFNTNKKIMMAQAVISTAAGVAGALAAPFGLGIPLAIAIGALGAAQLAIIAGTQYESSYTPQQANLPDSLTIGSRNSPTVDLAKGSNANAGGEAAYVRGSSGYGSDASNYRTIGSAYGGDPFRGYGNRGFVVGEKGPEIISPDTPINVTPANDTNSASPIDATIHINAIDAQGVKEVLVSQKGNIIKMLRDAANASGQKFLEEVNVNVYTRPNVGKL